MENTVKRIIEIEYEAQSLVAEGHAIKEKIHEDALLECKNMEMHIMESAGNKIKQLEARNFRESEDRIIRIYEDTALKMRLMEENAEENQRKWEDEIFNHIIGR